MKFVGIYSFCLFGNNVYPCVYVCVCLCVNFFFLVKDFSGTSAPKNLKFGTNIGYDFLYCVRQNQHPHTYHSLYLFIFSFYQIIFVTDFSGTTSAGILKFGTNIGYN